MNRTLFSESEEAAQLWRYIGDMLCSASVGVHLIGSYQGGGSPIMEAMAITTQYDIESRKKMVKRLAGIPERAKKAVNAYSEE